MRKANASVPVVVLLILIGFGLSGSRVLAEKKSKEPAQGAETALVWPPPPEQPRVRFVKLFNSDAQFKKKSKWRRLMLGPEQEEIRSLQKPYGVAVDGTGRVYVTDTDQAAVLVFDDAAREVRSLGDTGHVRLVTPVGIAVDRSGNVFVGDVGLSEVVSFDPSGQLRLVFGSKEGVRGPSGIVVDETRSRVLVADSREHKIFVFTPEGALLETWGERGSGDGQFNYPTNIAIGPDGRVYVVDTGNFRVQILSPEGRFLSAFGKAGDGFGDFHRPKGIGVDSEGHIYVADAAFNNFQIFDEKGALLLFVGTMGKDPGAFWLPAGLHVDATDRVFVVDQINARVQVFQYLKGGEGSDRLDGASGRASQGGDAPSPAGRR